jgi:glycosyltransferase involved in cell wall biosynthesis
VEDQALASRLASSSDDRLRHLPPESAPERYFRAADLHLLLSYREGLPNVVLEAAASGVPTFAFDVVGVRDAVVPGATGALFPFRNVRAVANAITLAEQDRDSFQDQFSGASDYVLRHFEQRRVWEAYAAEYLLNPLVAADHDIVHQRVDARVGLGGIESDFR